MRLRFHGLAAASIICSLLMLGCVRTVPKDEADSLPDLKTEQSFFIPPLPKSFSLSNGIKVYLIEDHELPLVNGTLYIPGGSLWEKDADLGLSSFMGTLLRSGGAGSRGPKTLDRDLEKLAASITSSFGAEYGTVSFSCLSADLEKLLPLYADVVLRPRFDVSRLEILKTQVLEQIKRRKDDPITVAGISFKQLVFGESPYGRILRSNDISRISRQKIKDSYQQLFNPQGAIFALSGDISEEEARYYLEKHFASWRNKAIKNLLAPDPPLEGRPGVYFIELPFQQATVIMGELGLPRFTPDWFSILVFNEIFGGGGRFSSRLMKNVRSEKGLAYAVEGAINPSFGKGVNTIVFQTKAATAAESTYAALGVLNGLRNGALSAVEVDEAKRAIENSFVFKFDTSNEIVRRKAGQKLLGFPEDYDQSYLSNIAKVGPADVIQVAQSRWHPKSFTIVVVGNRDAYESISSLLKGPLSGYNLTRVEFDETLVGY